MRPLGPIRSGAFKLKRESGDNNGSNESNLMLDDEVVEPGKVIQVDICLRDEEGLNVQTDQESFDIIVGVGQLLPKIENALIGLRSGDRQSIRLRPQEAFGEWDAAKIIDFDRDEFPTDVAAGDHFEAEQTEGGVLVLRIIEVAASYVRVDLKSSIGRPEYRA